MQKRTYKPPFFLINELIVITLLLLSPAGLKSQDILTESFDSGSFPNGWSVDMQGANWGISLTGNSGGQSPEMGFHGSPAFYNISRLVLPTINAQGISMLKLEFSYAVEHLAPGYTFGVAARNGNGNWQSIWTKVPVTIISLQQQTVVIHYPGFNAMPLQLAFFFQGNSQNVQAIYLDDIRLFVPPLHDIAAKSINNPNIFLPNAAISPVVVITNLGQQTESQVPVSCRIYDGSNTLVYNKVQILGTLLAAADDSLVFPPYTLLNVNDFYRIEASVQLPGDLLASNDSVSKQISTLSLVPRRFVFTEVATATWCSQCPPTAQAVHDMVYSGKQIAVADYHSSFGDPFTNEASSKRLLYYGIQGFPTAVFDGLMLYPGNVNAYTEYVNRYNARMQQGSPYDLRIFGSHSGSNYNLNVIVDRMAPVMREHLVLRVFVTEGNIAYPWQGQTQVNHVTRLVLPDNNGYPLDLVQNVQVNIPLSFSMDPGWVPEHCEIIAIIQDTLSKEVMQVNRRDYYELVPMGFTKIQGYLRYANAQNTALPGVTVRLRLGGGVVASTTTNASGYYSFTGIAPGTYSLACSSVAPAGGVNAVDALLVMKYFVSLETLDALQLKSADNDVSNYVNTVDALNIMQRFVEAIPKFTQADWVFESPQIQLPNSTIVTRHIRGLCTGDVDGSYLP